MLTDASLTPQDFFFAMGMYGPLLAIYLGERRLPGTIVTPQPYGPIDFNCLVSSHPFGPSLPLWRVDTNLVGAPFFFFSRHLKLFAPEAGLLLGLIVREGTSIKGRQSRPLEYGS